MARTPIHHGETLAERLDELERSAAELARVLGVPPSRITRILNGKGGVTPDTALRLGRFFGNDPFFWLNLQQTYQLRLAEQRVGVEIERTVVPRTAA